MKQLKRFLTRNRAYQDNQDKIEEHRIEKDRIEGLIQALIKDSNLWDQYICVNYNLDGKEESLYLQQGLRACPIVGKVDIYEYKDDTITFKETTKECDLSWMFKIPKTNFYSKETIEVNEEDKGGFVAKKYKERGAI